MQTSVELCMSNPENAARVYGFNETGAQAKPISEVTDF
jgi:hypothetical protein